MERLRPAAGLGRWSTEAKVAREGWVKATPETLTPAATVDLAALGLQSKPNKTYKDWNCTHCYI